MFRKSQLHTQINMFSSIGMMLMCEREQEFFDDKNAWHNVFNKNFTSLVDESIFEPMYKANGIGAPTASIRILVAMCVLKEGLKLSDERLNEACGYNLLVRRALGLDDLSVACPSLDTYYCFRRRIVEYEREYGVNLLSECCQDVTRRQTKAFRLKGSHLRMDSKLVCSNIAFYTRYRNVHACFCKGVTPADLACLKSTNQTAYHRAQDLLQEDAEKTIYTSNTEELQGRMLDLGYLIYDILRNRPERVEDILQRVFDEQFVIGEDTQLTILDGKKVSSDSIQNPNDEEASYRKKGNQVVRGYVTNITETVDEENAPNLITDVQVAPATASDNAFVKDAIEQTEAITENKVERIYADGAYHSAENQELGVELVLTGLTGFPARYSIERVDGEVHIVDTQTGEEMEVTRNRNGDKWRIRTENGYQYFTENDIQKQEVRRMAAAVPWELKKKRNNVEATIYHYAQCLEKNKSRYRGLLKLKMQAWAQCSWINLVRIVNFILRQELQLA